MKKLVNPHYENSQLFRKQDLFRDRQVRRSLKQQV